MQRRAGVRPCRNVLHWQHRLWLVAALAVLSSVDGWVTLAKERTRALAPLFGAPAGHSRGAIWARRGSEFSRRLHASGYSSGSDVSGSSHAFIVAFKTEGASAKASALAEALYSGDADSSRPAFHAEVHSIGGHAAGATGEHAASTAQAHFSTVAGLLSDQALEFVRANPDVAYVEYDAPVELTVSETARGVSATSWGLDRIDSEMRPVDGTFSTTVYGEAELGSVGTVDAYVLDSGVDYDHEDFDGRAIHGTETVDGSGSSTDCHGHGTHVAGTIGSTTYGVAPNVQIVSVRVVDCNGNGFASGVATAVQWVIAEASAKAPQRRGVINLSVSVRSSAANVQSLDDAVEDAAEAGIVVVMAAGNADPGQAPEDACTRTPGRSEYGITVGAIRSTDTLASFSNWGTCVDILAPGENIVSLSVAFGPDTFSPATQSGTSMASPHVAGAAASLLMAFPLATVEDVRSAILCASVPDVIGDIDSYGAGTPNLLLHVPAGGWGDSVSYMCDQADCSVNGCSGHGECVASTVSSSGFASRCDCDCGWEGRRCDFALFVPGPFPVGSVTGSTLGRADFFGHTSPDLVVVVDVPTELYELEITLCSLATNFDTMIHVLTPQQCPRLLRNIATAEAVHLSDDGEPSACPEGAHSAPYTPSALSLRSAGVSITPGEWKFVVGGYNTAKGTFEMTINADGDCFVSEWSEWGSCMAETEGQCDGAASRTRTVTSPAVAGYAGCPELHEQVACSSACGQACGVECGENEWEVVRCSEDSPRQCSACAVCEVGEFEHEPCSQTTDRVCSACSAACATCNGPGASNCTACGTDFWDTGGTIPPSGLCLPCSAHCPAGTFPSDSCSAVSDLQCSDCHPSCASCSGELASDCDECAEEYRWEDDGEYGGLCVPCAARCSVGQFESAACTWQSDRQCADCDPSCSACSGDSASQCTSCAPGTYATFADEEHGACAACRAECSDGEFELVACTQTSDRECRNCHGSCRLCEGGDTNADCTECAAGYFASDGGVCKLCTACGVDELETAPCTPHADRECATCHAACSGGCSDLGDTGCNECAAGYFDTAGVVPPDGTCARCEFCNPIAQYIVTPCTSTSDRVCGACADECEGCTGSTAADCLSCAAGNWLVDGVCTPCTECQPGLQAEVTPCTESSDRTCEWLENCGEGFFATQRDPELACSPCGFPEGCGEESFELQPCGSDADHVCQNLTQCLDGMYELRAPTLTSDRQCAPCSSPCSEGLFALQQCDGSHDRICAPCSDCNGDDEYEQVECNADSDTMCAPCTDAVESCAIDCVVADWGAWGSCSSACGRGTQLRTRAVLVPARYGGAPCPTVSEQRDCSCPDLAESSPGVPELGICWATPDSCGRVVVSVVLQLHVDNAAAVQDEIAEAVREATASILEFAVFFPDGDSTTIEDVVVNVDSVRASSLDVSASIEMNTQATGISGAEALTTYVRAGDLAEDLQAITGHTVEVAIERVSVYAVDGDKVSVTRVADASDIAHDDVIDTGGGSSSDRADGSASLGDADRLSGQEQTPTGGIEGVLEDPWGLTAVVVVGVGIVCGVGGFVFMNHTKSQSKRLQTRVVPVQPTNSSRSGAADGRRSVPQEEVRRASPATRGGSHPGRSIRGSARAARQHDGSPGRSARSGRAPAGARSGTGSDRRLRHHSSSRSRERRLDHERWQHVGRSVDAARALHGAGGRAYGSAGGLGRHAWSRGDGGFPGVSRSARVIGDR